MNKKTTRILQTFDKYRFIFYILAGLIAVAVALHYKNMPDETADPEQNPLYQEAIEYERSLDIRALIIDIGGNGIQLSKKTVYWDINENGFGNATQWIEPDNGFLVIDRNKNNRVDDHSEIIGQKNGISGFKELASFDDNNDGIIDAQDSVFSELMIWQDKNVNGYTNRDELTSLTDAGITTLSLKHHTLYDWAEENNGLSALEISRKRKSRKDNTITATSFAATTSGEQLAVADIRLYYDTMNTHYRKPVKIILMATMLPGIRGYGLIKDMSVRLSEDNDKDDPQNLLELVSSFSSLSFDQLFLDYEETDRMVETILFRWAETDKIAPESRGQNIDARHLATVEKITGNQFRQLGLYKNPRPHAAHMLEQSFKSIFHVFKASLMVQRQGQYLFTESPFYNRTKGTITGGKGLDSERLERLQNFAEDAEKVPDPFFYWVHIVRFINNVIKLADLSHHDRQQLDRAIRHTVPDGSLHKITAYLEWEKNRRPRQKFTYTAPEYSIDP